MTGPVRAAVLALRHTHRVDDLVLRVQAQLDAEEVQLAGVIEDD